MGNGIFDSTFFGTQHLLSSHLGNGASYASAAAIAVTLDYSVDVVVKRMMIIPPELPVKSLRKTWVSLFSGQSNVFQVITRIHSGRIECESYGICGELFRNWNNWNHCSDTFAAGPSGLLRIVEIL